MIPLLPTVPRWLREALHNCPAAGAGVHTWLFAMARQLHFHYPNKNELADLLAKAVSGCGRLVPRGEIEAAVADSEFGAWRPNWLVLPECDDPCGEPRAETESAQIESRRLRHSGHTDDDPTPPKAPVAIPRAMPREASHRSADRNHPTQSTTSPGLG